MHGFSKFNQPRTLAIALAIFLGIFGTSAAKLSAQARQGCNTCNMCPSSNAQHEAAEDRARAEKALKHAQDEAAEHRAAADQAIQEGNEKAAQYEAKANARLEKGEEAMACNACNPCGATLACPSSKAQHEAAEDRARAENARKHAEDQAAAERAKADQAIQEGNEKAAHYEAKANSRLEKGEGACNMCATTTTTCNVCGTTTKTECGY